jgi:hypothetical protein
MEPLAIGCIVAVVLFGGSIAITLYKRRRLPSYDPSSILDYAIPGGRGNRDHDPVALS